MGIPGVLHEMAGLVAFVRTVESGSFSHAAKILGVSPSAASKSVSRLESIIGAKLFRRSTRTLILTEAGDAFYERVKPLLQQIEDSSDVLALHRSLAGHLRISLPGELGKFLLKPIFNEFLKTYRDISLEISMTDLHVDIIRENFDVVFRVGQSSQSSLMSRTLAHLEMALVASPSFIAEHGEVMDIDRLLELPFARYKFKGKVYPIRFLNGREITPRGSIDLDSAAAIREAANCGVGVGHIVRSVVQEDIERGQLVEIFPTSELSKVPFQALHAFGRMPTHRLTLLIDFVSRTMRKPREV